MSNGNSICSQCQGLGDITSVSDTAGINQGDFIPFAQIIECFTCLSNGCNSGNPGFFRGQMWTCACSSFHSIDIDAVRTGFDGHTDIIVNPCCSQFELDRNFSVGCFPDFINFQCKIIGAQPVGMPGWRALIDSCRK